MSTKVTAELQYFSPPTDGSKAYTYINADTSTGVRPQNWEAVPHDLEIENIRGREGDYTLDNAGFYFGNEKSAHTAFVDDKAIENEYYPESIELVKKITGATRAVIFDHSEFPFPEIDVFSGGLKTFWLQQFVVTDLE